MVGSVNKVILLGNLGRDPDIRSMQSGSKMASFSIATSKRWKDKATQEQRDKTSWHNIVVFGDGLVDIVEKTINESSNICVVNPGCIFSYNYSLMNFSVFPLLKSNFQLPKHLIQCP